MYAQTSNTTKQQLCLFFDHMKQHSSHKRHILSWLAVLIWMGLIYYLSSVPSLHSGLPSMWDLVLRKGAHIIEYFVLTVLVWNALRHWHIWRVVSLQLATVIALIYAMIDEYHQSFVLGRSGNWNDVGIDAIGIVLALVVVWKWKR